MERFLKKEMRKRIKNAKKNMSKTRYKVELGIDTDKN